MLSFSEIHKRLTSVFGDEKAHDAILAMQRGEIAPCYGEDWFYTWSSYDGGSELFISNGVGDFAAVYDQIVSDAREGGFKRVSFNTERGRAFSRRLKSLGFEPHCVTVGNQQYIIVEIA